MSMGMIATDKHMFVMMRRVVPVRMMRSTIMLVNMP